LHRAAVGTFCDGLAEPPRTDQADGMESDLPYVAERESERRLALAGRHRFSRYRLIFELDDGAPGATVLRASTYAIFPGVHGWLYRAMVIGTRLHVLATRGILHAVRRRSVK